MTKKIKDEDLEYIGQITEIDDSELDRTLEFYESIEKERDKKKTD